MDIDMDIDIIKQLLDGHGYFYKVGLYKNGWEPIESWKSLIESSYDIMYLLRLEKCLKQKNIDLYLMYPLYGEEDDENDKIHNRYFLVRDHYNPENYTDENYSGTTPGIYLMAKWPNPDNYYKYT